jgi:O-methyltransferase
MGLAGYRRGANSSQEINPATATRDVRLRKSLSRFLLPRHSVFLDQMNWFARWLETVRRYSNCAQFAVREKMYSHLNGEYLGDGKKPIDYLEFGVYEGRSLAYWTALNAHPDSRFFGFDSFEGLPEGWNRENPVGSYNAEGKIPQIDDSRVQFVVGWFQKSLPPFLVSHRPKSPLVLHCDGDLYSSTLCSLASMDPWIVPGTLIIFDEFFDPVHEYRALEDYAAAYMRKYEVVAATRDFVQAAIRIT